MNRKALVTIFTIVLTDLIGFGIIIPLLPQISQNYGIVGFRLGLLISSYAIAQFISAPILGNLSDRYGRKPILVISKLGTVIAYIIFAFSHSFIPLLVSRLIDGFTGGNIPAARAYISDITTRENRSKGMAVIGIAFGLGFIFGPALGGIFYAVFHTISAPALAGAVLSFVSMLMTFFLLDESHRKNQVIKHRSFSWKNFFSIFQHPDIKKILIVQFLLMIVMSGYQTTLTFFTDRLFGFAPDQNSILFVYLGILGLIVQGYLIRKTFKNNLVATRYGLIIMAIAICLIAVSPNIISLAVFLGVNSIGGGIIGVTLPTLLSTTSSTDPEGEIQGAYEGVGSLGRVIGPAVIGSMVTYFPRPVYFLIGVMALAIPSFLPVRSKS
jgi:MFS transporter, DHA1 family, tetracycline resistance protein